MTENRTRYLLRLMGDGALTVLDAGELKRLLEERLREYKDDRTHAWRLKVLILTLEHYILGRTNLMLEI